MYYKNLKHLPWVESIEVARPTICGFDTQKPLFSGVFAVFSGTAHELIVPAKPPKTHPSSHLMRKELTNLLNLLDAAQFQVLKIWPCIVK